MKLKISSNIFSKPKQLLKMTSTKLVLLGIVLLLVIISLSSESAKSTLVNGYVSQGLETSLAQEIVDSDPSVLASITSSGLDENIVDLQPLNNFDVIRPSTIAQHKLGYNQGYLVGQLTDEETDKFWDMMRDTGAGWVLGIATGSGELGETVSYIKKAHENGIRPFLRFCWTDFCNWNVSADLEKTAEAMCDYLKEVYDQTGMSYYVSVGPNEPGAEMKGWGFTQGDWDSLNKFVKLVFNCVRSDREKDYSGIKMSPIIFNIGNQETPEKRLLEKEGLFDGEDGKCFPWDIYAINTYNTQPIGNAATRAYKTYYDNLYETAHKCGIPIVVTETGNYDSTGYWENMNFIYENNGMFRWRNYFMPLLEEIRKFEEDPMIIGVLFYRTVSAIDGKPVRAFPKTALEIKKVGINEPGNTLTEQEKRIIFDASKNNQYPICTYGDKYPIASVTQSSCGLQELDSSKDDSKATLKLNCTGAGDTLSCNTKAISGFKLRAPIEDIIGNYGSISNQHYSPCDISRAMLDQAKIQSLEGETITTSGSAKVAKVGDSISFNEGYLPLEELRSVGVAEVINSAKNGAGTASFMPTSGMYPTDPEARSKYESALNQKPNIVVLMLGTNDCGGGDAFLSEYTSNLESLASEAEAAGAKVIMVAFPNRRSNPRPEPNIDCGVTNEQNYRNALINVASKNGRYLVRGDQVVSDSQLDPDGLHVSDYSSLNQAIKSKVAEILGTSASSGEGPTSINFAGQTVPIDHSLPVASTIKVGGYDYPLPGWAKAVDCAAVVGRTNVSYDPHLSIQLTPGSYLGFASEYRDSATTKTVPTLGFGSSAELETFTVVSSRFDKRFTVKKDIHEEILYKIIGADPVTQFYYDPTQKYKPENACTEVKEVVNNAENFAEGPVRLMPDSQIQTTWPSDGHVCWDSIHKEDPIIRAIDGDPMNRYKEGDTVATQCGWVGYRSGCSEITGTCASRHATCPFNSHLDYSFNKNKKWATNVDRSTCYFHRGSEADIKARYMRADQDISKRVSGNVEIGGTKDILANLFTEAQRRLKVTEGELRSLLIDAEKDVPVYVEQYTYDLNKPQTPISGGFNIDYQSEYCKVPGGQENYSRGAHSLVQGDNTIKYVTYMKDLNTITVLLDILTNVLPSGGSVNVPTIDKPIPDRSDLEAYVGKVTLGARQREFPRTSFPIADSNSPWLSKNVTDNPGSTPYDFAPTIIGWCDQNGKNSLVQRLLATAAGEYRYGTWHNDLLTKNLCVPNDACYEYLSTGTEPGGGIDIVPGDGICPLQNGICTQGPTGEYSHGPGNLNAVDLGGGNVVAPTDGEVLLSLPGRTSDGAVRFTRCGNGSTAGGAIWFKAYYKDSSGATKEQILFLYHVYVPFEGALNGTYKKGDVITRLSTAADADHDAYPRDGGNACSSGPHTHVELASGASGSKSELNQRGPITELLASWTCRFDPSIRYAESCKVGTSVLGTSTENNGKVLAEDTATQQCNQSDLRLYPVSRARQIPGCVEPSGVISVSTDLPYFADKSTPQDASQFTLIPDAASAFTRMMNDMKSSAPSAYATCGVNWGYRSAALQESFGQCGSRSTACKCHSEHQLGTTLDFKPRDGSSVGNFDDTLCYDWLRNNATRYGFVQSYTPGNPDYSTEPWHWRWLPGDHASQFKNSEHTYLVQYLENLCGVEPTPDDGDYIDPNLPLYCQEILKEEQENDDDDDDNSGTCNEFSCGLADGNDTFEEALSCAAGISYYHTSTDEWIDRYGPFCDNETNFAGFEPKDNNNNGLYEARLPFAYNYFNGCYDKILPPSSPGGRSCATLPPREVRPADASMSCPAYSSRVGTEQYDYYRGALQDCSIPINQTYWTNENALGFYDDPAGLAQELVRRGTNYYGRELSDTDLDKITAVMQKAKDKNINPIMLTCFWATETWFGQYCAR